MTKFSASQQSQLAQIGAFLREHREKQNKSLEDIAIRTYIRPQLLGGIETGNPDLLPEPVFVQGFIRRYAETLGLKGIELAQQFTVTSIPSTPRPARSPEASESSTTRLTRAASASSTAATSTSTSTNVPADSTADSMFNAGSLSPVGEPFPNSPGDTPSKPKGQPSKPKDIPLIVDDAVLAQTATPAEASTGFDLGFLDEDREAPDSNTELNTDFSLSAASGAAVTDSASTFNPQNLSTSSLDTEIPQFDDELPAAFTTQSTAQSTQKTDPNLAAARTPVYTPEPVGVEYADDTAGPNLKPFAIGAVVIAAITAGMVLLANMLGGDRPPTVADGDSVGDSSAIIEPDTEILPDLPPEPVAEAPPASTAPVYIEIEATADSYVLVETDGVPVFQDTMLPGDQQLWEAQEEIFVYSGNAGGLSISENGGPSEVLGGDGLLEERTYSAEN